MEYIKSPLNYTGGKFKLLPQLLELFPKDINTFVDLFGGGGNVAVNVEAKHIIYNDIMWQVPEMLWEFRSCGATECLRRIDKYIERYNLTQDNKEGFLRLRKLYNTANVMDPIMLYTLICYSYNCQIRFNSKLEFNGSFGKDRSSFNSALREKFISFVNRLQELDIEFSSKDFRQVNMEGLGKNDFVYCDPPYSVTCAVYNDGKRGFSGWTAEEDKKLFEVMDTLDRAGVKFALSNMLESKGKSNEALKEWAIKYNIRHLDSSYSNCSYQRGDKTSKDVEILITNY
jgi:DNA adenine methylase Dam